MIFPFASLFALSLTSHHQQQHNHHYHIGTSISFSSQQIESSFQPSTTTTTTTTTTRLAATTSQDNDKDDDLTAATTTTTKTKTTTTTKTSNNNKDTMKVVQLARFPIKGLAPDQLSKVHISSTDFIPTFPDDRRFALLQQKSRTREDYDSDNNDNDNDNDSDDETIGFDSNNLKWIHKEHFLCAFTQPEFMAQFHCEYKIIDNDTTSKSNNKSDTQGDSYSYCLPNDDIIPIETSTSTNNETTNQNQNQTTIQRMITIYKRQYQDDIDTTTTTTNNNNKNHQLLLGPVDLNTVKGREELENFFMEQYQNINNQEQQQQQHQQQHQCQSPILKCITATDTTASNTSPVVTTTSLTKKHVHQFGNTRSGIKNNNNDTRTIHIINSETVKEFSSKLGIGIDIDPMRFRPNLVISGLDPWKEFDFVGKTLKVISSSSNNSNNNDDHNDDEMRIKVLSTTVRCAGVGVDPSEHPDKRQKLDIPILLNKHYPQYGPYLGVYATIQNAGSICIGDTIELCDD